MNTRFLMISTALFLGIAGIGLTFLPDEIVSFLEITANPTTTIAFQLIGALYLGFAMLNWMSKGNLIGGIYNRPVAIGNFMHFTIGSLALIKAALKIETNANILFLIAGIYLAFAILFALVFRSHPKNVKNDGD